jgi:hypothetical protein
MSYTSVDMVRRYLSDSAYPGPSVTDQRLVLEGVEYISFCNGPVDGDSVVVKSIRQTRPARVAVSVGEGSVSFHGGPVVPGTIVAASDSSLGTVYVENVDYIVDYAAGDLHLKPDGSIAPSAEVVIWYLPFTIFYEGVDYSLDSLKGRLRRFSDGAIADGEAVLLDHSSTHVSWDDDLIGAAVAEANGTVEREIDPSGDFGADPGLQAAATYRALAIVGRAAAMRALSVNKDDRAAVAWLKLVDAFSERADEHLARFHPAASGPSGPTHS